MTQQDEVWQTAIETAQEFHEPVFVFYDPELDAWDWGIQCLPVDGEILICEIRRFARL
jgi:hypothetical protein